MEYVRHLGVHALVGFPRGIIVQSSASYGQERIEIVLMFVVVKSYFVLMLRLFLRLLCKHRGVVADSCKSLAQQRVSFPNSLQQSRIMLLFYGKVMFAICQYFY